MRTARILYPGTAYYHVMSRVVDGNYIFGDEEKARFRHLMRGLEHLLGVRVLTYCIMSNHFHILVEVPDQDSLLPAEKVSDEELVSLVRPLYGEKEAERLRMELANCDDWGFEEKKVVIRNRFLDRRGKLDEFMKSLKQRFSQWYNRKMGRRGTLWEDRFKSVAVGNSEEALLAMAAYIDLNPLRALMVNDPAEYGYSGYGEAVGGNKKARSGLAIALECRGEAATWKLVGREYRELLYGVGVERGQREDGSAIKPGFDHAEALKVIQGGGELPLWKILRCRVRYMSDGAVFGSRRFVEEVFEQNRDRFGKTRKDGARLPKGRPRMGRLGGAAGSAFGSVWVESGASERAIRARAPVG